MKKTCLNCNLEGHKFKSCKLPIQSYGIIAYQKKAFETIKFLLIQRKDTIAYTDFLRGKYKKEHLDSLITQMTKKEKENLSTKNFETLWDELWFDHNSNIYKNEKEKAREIFNLLDLNNLIDPEVYLYLEPEWGLPKGRRSLYESPINCAIREFSEETELHPKEYNIHYDIPPLVEEFKASDEKIYKHVYYFAKLNANVDIKKTRKTKIFYQEVGCIGLFDLHKCLEIIRDYSPEKKKIIIEGALLLKDIKTSNITWN